MRRPSLFVILVLSACLLPACGDQEDLKQIGTLPLNIKEASGLVKSRTHEGVFWTVCDSGNSPHLYAIDLKGKLLAEFKVKDALNLDWEALAIDDEGYLYIGDVGNNAARALPVALPARWVYRVKGPDPKAAAGKESPSQVPVDRAYSFTYPAEPFDVEGMFYLKENLYLISKVEKGPTKLYRLPVGKGDKSAKLVEVGELPGVSLVTDASLSADGKRLAVCSYGYAARFDLDPDKALDTLQKQKPTVVPFPAKTDIEGCCWDGDELVLVSESREVYRLRFKK